MNITNIIFRKTFDSGKLRAIASITIDGCLAIHEIKVIQTDHLFIAMPYRTDIYGVATTLRIPSAERHVTNLKARSSARTRNISRLTKLLKLKTLQRKKMPRLLCKKRGIFASYM